GAPRVGPDLQPTVPALPAGLRALPLASGQARGTAAGLRAPRAQPERQSGRPLRWNDVRNGRTWEEMRAREEAQRAERPDLTATQPACESTGDAPTFKLLNGSVTICIIPQRVMEPRDATLAAQGPEADSRVRRRARD